MTLLPKCCLCRSGAVCPQLYSFSSRVGSLSLCSALLQYYHSLRYPRSSDSTSTLPIAQLCDLSHRCLDCSATATLSASTVALHSAPHSIVALSPIACITHCIIALSPIASSAASLSTSDGASARALPNMPHAAPHSLAHTTHLLPHN